MTAELLRTGMISPEDMNLFLITDDVNKAVDDIVTFYKLAITRRVTSPTRWSSGSTRRSPTACWKRLLNDTYGKILASGKIEQFPGPIDGEQGDRPDKVRLSMKFNRKSIGQLRLMVNDINRLE